MKNKVKQWAWIFGWNDGGSEGYSEGSPVDSEEEALTQAIKAAKEHYRTYEQKDLEEAAASKDGLPFYIGEAIPYSPSDAVAEAFATMQIEAMLERLEEDCLNEVWHFGEETEDEDGGTRAFFEVAPRKEKQAHKALINMFKLWADVYLTSTYYNVIKPKAYRIGPDGIPRRVPLKFKMRTKRGSR